ncbi:lipase [Spirochaetia bacterium]|nr:lipase [Spirochaetia bacterium]
MTLTDKDRILFNGDSITDADRDRNDTHSLSGYTKKIAAALPGVECFNRAIGGDTSAQMLKRFTHDCEDTRPSVLSIFIGINDTWRRYDSNVRTPSAQFADNYRSILNIARQFTDRIILLEPYVIPADPEKMVFYEDVYEKVLAIRAFAREYKTVYIPLDGIFAEACVQTPPGVFSEDGIHPTDAGHGLIAAEWLKRCSL